MKTTTLAAVLAVLWVFPAAAQETPPDTTTYESAPAPVWIVVEDAGAGAHQVGAAILWDDSRSILRFSTDVRPGHLLAFLPTSATAEDLTEVCVFSSGYMAHESQGYSPMERDDPNCTAPPVAALPFVAVEHRGSPLTCVEANRADGGAEPPTRRYFGCYWEHKPGG